VSTGGIPGANTRRGTRQLLPRIAAKEGELGTVLGLGAGYMLERWNLSEEEWGKDKKLGYWKMGHPKHHGSDEAGQCGLLINLIYNRDAVCHSHTNFIKNGLPLHVQKKAGNRTVGLSRSSGRPGRFQAHAPVKGAHGQMGPDAKGAS